LLKAGIVAEELGNNDKALEFYKEIQVKYPQTFEGYEVNKYISRLKIK
jgi:TolA-binding protein